MPKLRILVKDCEVGKKPTGLVFIDENNVINEIDIQIARISSSALMLGSMKKVKTKKRWESIPIVRKKDKK